MNKLPITLLFIADPTQPQILSSLVTDFRTKSEDYKLFQNVVGYVGLSDSEKPLLPDGIEALLEGDVKPTVKEENIERSKRLTRDIANALDSNDLHTAQFTLLVRCGISANTVETQLEERCHIAASVLAGNKDVISVSLRAGFGQKISDQLSVSPMLPMGPTMFRTRDLWIAAKTAGDLSLAQSFNPFSAYPHRFLTLAQ